MREELNTEQKKILEKAHEYRKKTENFLRGHYRISQHFAEEITSQAMENIANYLLRSDENTVEKAGTFLTTTAKWAFINQFKKRSNRLTVLTNNFNTRRSDDTPYEESFNFPPTLDKKDFWKSIENILPQKQYEVVVMRHIQGMSFPMISEETNVSIKVLSERHTRARHRIKEHMPEDVREFNIT